LIGIEYIFEEKLKENGFGWERIFKDGFVLKIVPNIERRDKDKPSEGLECYMKVWVTLKSV
jgi:hypothetical protein